jgi:hypothetical protein
MLDFGLPLASCSFENITIEFPDTGNIGLAVGILLLPVIEPEICSE